MSTTVRISDSTHRRLVALAVARGERLQQVLERAVADLDERSFWEDFTQGYARLADDAGAWAEVGRERAAEAPSLRDGME